MRKPSRTFLPNVSLHPAALALTALALAACGTVSAASGPGAPATSAAGQARSAVSPEQQARTDAAAILAAFVPPPGAARLGIAGVRWRGWNAPAR